MYLLDYLMCDCYTWIVMTTANVMTRKQLLKAMEKAGVIGAVTGAGRVWEVELADEETMQKFCATVCALGGYRTGYGSWILRPGYEGNGDWNDKSSRWHY